MNSDGKEIQMEDNDGREIKGVKRGKFKAKRGRKPKKKVSQLDGGDMISDSQIGLCNERAERISS